jgi:hypothetical protein
MRESTSDLRSNDISAKNQDSSVQTRSYSAMVLSALLPGLGQIYLRQFVKGSVLFVVFVAAIGIFYINSYPVRGWQDLIRFKPTVQTETGTNDKANTETESERSIRLWTLDSGKTLMFRPSWILKVTSSIQAIVCWIYAVGDGWRGRRKST